MNRKGTICEEKKGEMMKKPRVLMVCCDGFENGGIQFVIMSIVRKLYREIDFEALVFSDGEQFYTKEFLALGGKIHHFKRYSGESKYKKKIDEFVRCKKYEMDFARFLRGQEKYDVIHCHNYFESAPFLKIASKFNIPIRIAHSHSVASPIKRKNPIYPWLELRNKKIINKYATNRAACSKAAGEYLFDSEPVQVIYNAIELNRFAYELTQENTDGTITFAHVGRYGFEKNQLFLLKVFSEYHLLNANSSLNLVGFGRGLNEVKNEIKRLNLEGCVKMLPPDTDIPEVYANADVVIYPSILEGLGISLIEAQAMGLKCYISEAIQPEADLGLCKVLRLADGPKKWALTIYDDIIKNGVKKRKVDMKNYDILNIISDYRKLYGIQDIDSSC